MLNDENKNICGKLLAYFGIIAQVMVAIEECSELIKALCKAWRCYSAENVENVKEELVDVLVMCQQLMLYFGMSMDEVNARAYGKLARAMERTINKPMDKEELPFTDD